MFESETTSAFARFCTPFVIHPTAGSPFWEPTRKGIFAFELGMVNMLKLLLKVVSNCLNFYVVNHIPAKSDFYNSPRRGQIFIKRTVA